MSEANKELAKLWFEEVWNKGRREAIRELLAPQAVIYDGGVARKGVEGFIPLGIPANKSLQTTGITIVRIGNGKFITGWQNWDMLGVMQQIKGEPPAPTYVGATP
jgi:hypothetical protein